jgi:hypothetical protein
VTQWVKQAIPEGDARKSEFLEVPLNTKHPVRYFSNQALHFKLELANYQNFK